MSDGRPAGPPLQRYIDLMAIINCTPDSFSDGGQFYRFGHIDSNKILETAVKAVEEGATILDIGGESTRPGSQTVPLEEEVNRVIPVIKLLHQELPQIKLSVDTRKAEVAKQALSVGASIINDISGFQFDPQMASIIASFPSVQFVLMHSQGNPDTMQNNPHYLNGVVNEVFKFFETQIEYAISQGIQHRQLILDPGFGFGKTVQHNMTLLKNLALFQRLELPLLVGLSRKSFLAPSIPAPERDLISVCAAHYALSQGVSILRVHNTSAHRQMLQLMNVLETQP